MAKRENSGKQTNAVMNTARTAPPAMTADVMEQRVVAFAEQLGRIVGTVQAKTEGWLDRDALNTQIAGVRDSAAELLEQLSAGVTSMTQTAKKTAAGAASKAKSAGRSGGVVDAPGKKHRKPMPADPRAVAAGAKGSNMRSNKASMKTMKTRGRG